LPKGRFSLKPEVVLASHNPGKLREFQAILDGAPLTLRLWPGTGEIADETADTYLGNVRIKAHTVARATGQLALADDSGVEVDWLQGQPGVRSARFVSDDPWHNTREILLRLIDVPKPQRTARMRAVVCLAWPDGRDLWAEGVLEGEILTWPRGQHGFGVDPIFSVDGQTSLAQWDDMTKNRISHRARALAALFKKLSVDDLRV
jgi:XTP/dITP diphosphohydrolase